METTVNKEQMDSLKALADTNMKISAAKEALFNLEEAETQYLVERERRAMDLIEKALEESREIVEETKTNYAEVHELCKTAQSFAQSLETQYDRFDKLINDFDIRSQAWENKIQAEQHSISEFKREIKEERIEIENTKKSLKQKEKLLENQRIHLESRQAALETSYRIDKKSWTTQPKTK